MVNKGLWLHWGVDKESLDSLVDIELSAWGGIEPDGIFYINRDEPFSNFDERWQQVKAKYDELMFGCTDKFNLHFIDNDSCIHDVEEKVKSIILCNERNK